MRLVIRADPACGSRPDPPHDRFVQKLRIAAKSETATPHFARASAVLTYNPVVVDREQTADLLFGALADRTRRDIFRRAHEGRLSVSALAREYPISLTAVQKHVAVLERAELVSRHRVGRESIVRAEADALNRVRAALEEIESAWRGRIERIDNILDEDKGDI
jgi:DNA-binding transcriptional ArsR family regulator